MCWWGNAPSETLTSLLPVMQVSRLEDRVAQLARIPVNHGEGVQVLRYEQSQKYNAHHDFFDPKRYATERRGGERERARERMRREIEGEKI